MRTLRVIEGGPNAKPRRNKLPLHGARRLDAMADRGFRERFRIARIALGYSEADMAADFGVSVKTVRKWEQKGFVRNFAHVIGFLDQQKFPLGWMFGENPLVVADLGRSNILILPACTPKGRERRERAIAHALVDAYKLLPPNKRAALIAYAHQLLQEEPTGAA